MTWARSATVTSSSTPANRASSSRGSVRSVEAGRDHDRGPRPRSRSSAGAAGQAGTAGRPAASARPRAALLEHVEPTCLAEQPGRREECVDVADAQHGESSAGRYVVLNGMTGGRRSRSAAMRRRSLAVGEEQPDPVRPSRPARSILSASARELLRGGGEGHAPARRHHEFRRCPPNSPTARWSAAPSPPDPRSGTSMPGVRTGPRGSAGSPRRGRRCRPAVPLGGRAPARRSLLRWISLGAPGDGPASASSSQGQRQMRRRRGDRRCGPRDDRGPARATARRRPAWRAGQWRAWPPILCTPPRPAAISSRIFCALIATRSAV